MIFVWNIVMDAISEILANGTPKDRSFLLHECRKAARFCERARIEQCTVYTHLSCFRILKSTKNV